MMFGSGWIGKEEPKLGDVSAVEEDTEDVAEIFQRLCELIRNDFRKALMGGDMKTMHRNRARREEAILINDTEKSKTYAKSWL